jgi:ABC-type multidrug transport system fused ATPase/permease subunit
MPGITVTQACKSYETSHYTVKAVNHADLSVESGEAVAIVGPSGSGKSTLLNIIGLILKPDSGSVAVDGEEVLNMGDRRCSAFRNASFGYIVQDFALLDDETVYHNIRIPLLYNRQIKRREHKPRIREIAQKLDISDKLNRKAGKLSGGERQRISIARCILKDAPIVILDEATASVDADNESYIQEAITQLCRGKTLLVIAHRLNTIRHADEILVIDQGRIVQAGDHDKLMAEEGIYRRFITARSNPTGWCR